MNKRFCGLIVILAVFCGVLALAAGSYAMNKQELKRDGDKLIIQWQYDNIFNNKSLAGTNVKINLYQNGRFVRTIAAKVPIGKNGIGSCSWDWGANKAFSSPDWWVKGKDYQIEIVNLTEPNWRIMGDKFDIQD